MTIEQKNNVTNMIRKSAEDIIVCYRRGLLCFRDAFNGLEELFHDVYDEKYVACIIEQEEIARILLSRKRTFNNVKITFREV